MPRKTRKRVKPKTRGNSIKFKHLNISKVLANKSQKNGKYYVFIFTLKGAENKN
mgnify:CR=1 FL=1